LVASQKADGGFSWKPDGPSDAFATGQTLYALSYCGLDINDAAVQKALKFLLDTQAAEGSWTVAASSYNTRKNKETILNRIYTSWGSAWAAIGMERYLSEK